MKLNDVTRKNITFSSELSMFRAILFKLEKTTKIKKYYSTKFEEISNQYESLMKDIQINERLYKSNHNFEPVTGEIYNLYKKESGEEFISIISPEEWKSKFEFIGKFQLTSDGRWSEVS